MNSLSKNLNRLGVACCIYIGNNKLNCVFFVDDICLLAPSLNSLQDLVIKWPDYAKTLKIFFTAISQWLYFSNPNNFVFQLLPFFLVPTLCLFVIMLNIEELNVMLHCYPMMMDDIYRQN